MSEKPLQAAYLFNGDDELKQETLVNRLKKRVEAVDDTAANIQVLNPKSIQSPAQLLDILNTLPFGSPYRLVFIHDVDQLKKPLMESLVGYLAKPSGTTVLAMTAKKLAKNTRLYKAIEKTGSQAIIDCAKRGRAQIPALVRGLIKSEGVDISSAAVSALIERVGDDTVALSSESKKLASIVKGKNKATIELDDVVQNVARLVEPKYWDLTNALALKRLDQCLVLLQRMKGFTDIGLFGLCVTRIREILIAKTLRQRGESVAHGMGKQEWQVRELIAGAELYSQSELTAILEDAPRIEKLMKTGADSKLLLEQWIISACYGNKI